MVQKNEDCSESVSSFDSGAIFPPSWGQELSRNVGGMSVYAFYRNPYWDMCSGMPPKNRYFHEISTFLETCRKSWKFGLHTWKLKHFYFGRPCRGLSTWKGDSPQKRYTWLVESFLALRVIQSQGKSRSNGLVKKWCKWMRKNEDFSKSVCSFDFGAIFWCSWGQELSRNVIVVSGYAF